MSDFTRTFVNLIYFIYKFKGGDVDQNPEVKKNEARGLNDYFKTFTFNVVFSTERNDGLENSFPRSRPGPQLPVAQRPASQLSQMERGFK